MSRHIYLVATLLAGALCATTLEKLSLEQMIDQSTQIVRGRPGSCTAAFRGSMIYTTCRVQVLERFKGAAAAQVEVSIPGGTARGLRQTVPGAPRLAEGEDYVLFLWTGKSGITHVIGLSQGVFTLQKDAAGGTTAVRPASSERMLDPATAGPVSDQSTRMSLGELVSRIQQRLGAAKQ